jgi:hypothetical protein
MRHFQCAMILLFACFATAPMAKGRATSHQDTDGLTEQFRLTRKGGGMGYGLDETVTFSTLRNRGEPFGYPRWIVERVKSENHMCAQPERCPQTTVHDWLDSGQCREVYLLAEGFADFRPQPNEQQITDTPLTTLRWKGESDAASSSLSEYVGPLVTWWDEWSKSLATCWSTKNPML